MPPTRTAQSHARELRQAQTPAEKLLWSKRRDRRLNGYKFRRQQPIGRYIADFFCPEARLIIELDGHSHAEQVEHDQERTRWLESEGYRVARFYNWDVTRNLAGVLQEIARLTAIRTPHPDPLPQGEREKAD
jgi:very-short-patch-repair endonuclease